MTDRERAMDPNTPPEELYDLAETYQEEVLANPVLPLLLMEDPAGVGAKIQGRAKRIQANRALGEAVGGLSRRQCALFAAACVEQAIPNFERIRRGFPETVKLLREAMADMKTWAKAGSRAVSRQRFASALRQLQTTPIESATLQAARAALQVVLEEGYSAGYARKAAQLAATATLAGVHDDDRAGWELAYARVVWWQVEVAAKAGNEVP